MSAYSSLIVCQFSRRRTFRLQPSSIPKSSVVRAASLPPRDRVAWPRTDRAEAGPRYRPRLASASPKTPIRPCQTGIHS